MCGLSKGNIYSYIFETMCSVVVIPVGRHFNAHVTVRHIDDGVRLQDGHVYRRRARINADIGFLQLHHITVHMYWTL
jgi:hypothetical protein